MRQRPSILVAAAASGFACLVLGLILGRPSEGQPIAYPAPAPAGPPGRFQASIGGQSTYVVVIDTWTGHCWTHLPNGPGPWQKLGTPTATK